MTMKMEPRVEVAARALTKQETAKYMRLTITHVERLIREGRLRPIRYPGVRRIFFDRHAVDLIIDQAQAMLETGPKTGPTGPKKRSKFGYFEVSRGIRR